jgi:hypothetical protein
VRAALPGGDAALFAARYGLDGPANFEGRWHLVVARELADLAAEDAAGRDPPRLQAALDAACATLRELRATRVPQGVEDKILTGWNALAIKGLADAARALQREDFAAAAAAALEFLRLHHWRDGRLLATSRGGEARLDAYLDDHALLIDAVLALLTVRFDARWLAFAASLADALLERFEDAAHGGFFFTAHDHEVLIHRSRNFHDDATPSGNAIAAAALQKLGWLLGEPRYLAAAERTLRAAWSSLAEAPLGQVHMANALEDYLNPHQFVILRGHQDQVDLWRRELQRQWRPRVSVIGIPAGATGLPAALADKPARGAIIAYRCRGSVCDAPADSLPALLQKLAETAD